MFPSEFDYHRAECIEEATELLENYPEAEVLAGGHSLIPMMKTGMADPPVIIDIGQIDALRGIEFEDEKARIGALTTYATVAGNGRLEKRCPAITEAAHAIGDIQVRNRGTFGGNIAHADPASDLPAAILAADATLEIHGPSGQRTIAADDFFLGMYATDVGEDELLTSIAVPSGNKETVGAYAKRPSPSSGYAIVGVAANLELDGDRIKSARLATNGVQQSAFRLKSVEAALSGKRLEAKSFETAAKYADEAIDEFMVLDDRQASDEFRTHLLTVYTERALKAAAERTNTEATST